MKIIQRHISRRDWLKNEKEKEILTDCKQKVDIFRGETDIKNREKKDILIDWGLQKDTFERDWLTDLREKRY